MNSPRNYFGLSAFWFATSFKWFILFFLLPKLVTDIVPDGEKNSWWGLIVAIGAAEAMIGPAIMGWLSDRTHSKFGRRRPYIAIGAAMTAIALLIMGNSNTIASLMIAYLLIQISDDIGTGPYSSAIPELIPENARGKASGQMGLLQLTGQLGAVAVGLALGSSPFLIFMVIAVVNVVCATFSIVAVARLERERGLEIEPPTASKISILTMWNPLKDRDFRWAWGTRFLNALGFYVILNYLVNYMRDVVQVYEFGPLKFDEPFKAAIAMAAIMALSGAISSIINGKRADVVGRKRVVMEAGWIMFFPLVAFCFVSSYALLFPLALVFGIGYGAYLSSDWALVSDVLPDKVNPARDMGVWQISVAAPQVCSGLIGFLIDQGNLWQPGNGYRIAFLVASVAMFLGSILVKKIEGST